MPAGVWDIRSVCALMCKAIIALLSRHQRQRRRMTQKINILNNPDIRDSWQENVFDYRRHFGKESVVVSSCQNCKWPWKDQFWWSRVRGKKIAVGWWKSLTKWGCETTNRIGAIMKGMWPWERKFVVFFWIGENQTYLTPSSELWMPRSIYILLPSPLLSLSWVSDGVIMFASLTIYDFKNSWTHEHEMSSFNI